MSADPKLSIVIPCRHNDGTLAALLPRLPVSNNVEVLVVEGDGPARTTAKLCETFGVKHLSATGCRGARLSMAASLARGEYLWFVHADAQPLPDSAETVIRILDAGAQGGYFRFGLTGERTVLKILTEWSVALRCRFGGIPYGDQGLFVRREAYVQVGGHLSAPLFEEARLVRRLRNMGGFNGIDVPIGVNPERWDQEGYLKRGLKNRLIVLAYWMGVSPWRLARWYSGS